MGKSAGKFTPNFNQAVLILLEYNSVEVLRQYFHPLYCHSCHKKAGQLPVTPTHK